MNDEGRKPFPTLTRKAVVAIAAAAAILCGGAAFAVSAATGESGNEVPFEATSAEPIESEPDSTSEGSLGTEAPASPAPVGERVSSEQGLQPSVLVASSALNRIVVIDPESGKTTRVLVADPTPNSAGFCDAFGSAISLSADSKWAYFDQQRPHPTLEYSCLKEIKRVPVAGGAVEAVTRGEGAAVSRNGTQIAFVRVADDTSTMDLVVRDLASGAERVLRSEEPGHVYTGASLSWSADDRKIAYSLQTCGCGDGMGHLLYVIDTTSGAATLVPTVGELSGRALSQPAYLDGDNAFVTASNVGAGGTGESVPAYDTQAVVVNLVTGQLVTKFSDGGSNPGLVSSADRSGKFIGFVAGSGTAAPDNLMVIRNGAKPVQLASGVIGVDWQ